MTECKRWTAHAMMISLSKFPRCSSCSRISLSQEIIFCSLLLFLVSFQASSLSLGRLQGRYNSCFVNVFDSPHHNKPIGCKSTTLKRGRTKLYGEGGGSTFSSSTAESIPPEVYRRRQLQQQLLQNTKQLDPAFNEKTQKGSYSSIGWSNRIGTVLTPVALPGVYTADRPFLWNTIDVSCRMTLIQMGSSTTNSNNDPTIKPDLFVHSPVRLDAQLKEAVDRLGVVKHIVSPNYEHVSFADKWAEEYPNANMWGCPGLIEREPQVKFTGELPFGLRPPSFPSSSAQTEALPTNIWDMNEIQAMHFDCEINPFTGRPFFNEVVFYHTPSKTLMMTDTYWNYPQVEGVPNSQYQLIKERVEQTSESSTSNETINDFGPWELAPSMKVPWKSLLWKFGMDQVYRPFYLNLMVGADSERQAKYESIVTFMLKEWDVETLIPAHGDIIRGKELIRQILQQHFGVNT